MKKQFKLETVKFEGKKIETFYTFEEAKQAFREKIISPEGIEYIINLIDDYIEELYPEETPEAFVQLKNILYGFTTDSAYPENVNDVALNYFEDENVEFYMESNKVFCYLNNSEYGGRFPDAEINALIMDDEDDEYFFYLAENNAVFGYIWNITLSRIKDNECDCSQ